MTFAPSDDSVKITLNGGLSQVVAMPGGATAVRLMAVKYPNAALAYVNFGDSTVSVDLTNGMPLNLEARAVEVIPVGAATHMAIVMSAGSAFDIMLTPGEVV